MSKKRVAVIGAGPSGLAQLRAFQTAAKMENRSLRSSALKNNPIGEACGITTGAQVSMKTGNPAIHQCTATFGPTGPRKV